MNAGDADSINTLAGITAAGNVNVTANSALTITALELTTNNATVAASGNLVILTSLQRPLILRVQQEQVHYFKLTLPSCYWWCW